MTMIAGTLGRILISLIFIASGLFKLGDLAGTEAAIVGAGMPGGLAIPAGVFELSAGILLALGFMQRIVALALMVFTALVSVLYHQNFTDPVQSAMFMKNLAIIGGLLLVFAHGYMAWGFKAYRSADVAHRETLAAQERAHAAELRAVRAETDRVAPTPPPIEGRTVVTDVDRDGIPEVRRRRWWQ